MSGTEQNDSMSQSDPGDFGAPAASGTTPGNVYIFNSVNDVVVSMAINNISFGSSSPVISAWSGTTPKYQASQAIAARTQDSLDPQTQPVFLAGHATQVNMVWQNFLGSFSIASPSTLDYDIQADLILYVTLGTAIMLDQTGRVVKDSLGTPQVITFTPTARN